MYRLVIVILLLEIVSRVIIPFTKRIRHLDAGCYFTEYLSREQIEVPGMFESRPYSIYWNRPNYFRNGYQITNSLGYRFMGEFDPDIYSPNSFKILVLGGSTTFSDFHSDDFKDSWTYGLGSILSLNYPNKDFRIFNAGLNAGMSSELLAHFVFEAQKISPDLVVLHGPGNDLLPLLLGDLSSDYRLTREKLQFGRRPGERFLVRHLGLVRLFYIFWLSRVPLSLFSTPKMPHISTQAQNAMTIFPSQFNANLKMFVGICNVFGFKLLLVDFLQAPKSKLVQIWPDLAESSEVAIQKMNHLMEEESRLHVTGLHHIKLDPSLFHEDLFLDNCHLNTQGEKLKAQAVSEYIWKNQII